MVFCPRLANVQAQFAEGKSFMLLAYCSTKHIRFEKVKKKNRKGLITSQHDDMSTHNFIYLFIFLIELPLESFVTTLKQKDPHWWPPTSGTLLSDHNHLWPRRGFWSQLNNFYSLRAYEHLAKNAKLLMRKLLFNRCLQDHGHTRTHTHPDILRKCSWYTHCHGWQWYMYATKFDLWNVWQVKSFLQLQTLPNIQCSMCVKLL